MQIWLSSDQHLGHDNMYKFIGFDGVNRMRGRFDTREQAEECMITLHNERVKASDHWYCLGDIAMFPWALLKVACFNGHKRLVLGNHDKFDVKKYREVFGKVMGSRKIDSLLLTHIPIHPGSIPHWAVGNVHGHIHDQPSPEGKYLNVSVEAIDYAPVPIEEVIQKLKEKG